MNRLALLLLPLTLWPSPVTASPLPIVAVLDSGVDLDCLASVNFTGDGDADLCGHGTEMGIIIRAADCQLLDVKIADDNGMVWASDLAAGIVWAADNGANYINISASLPADETKVIAEAVAYAVSRGVVVIAADIAAIPSYPACLFGVIAVPANGNGTASEATAFKTFTLVNQKGIR